MHARPWHAHTQEDYGRTLLKRNERGDREHTQQLLANALAAYRELGMPHSAARLEELAHQLSLTA